MSKLVLPVTRGIPTSKKEVEQAEKFLEPSTSSANLPEYKLYVPNYISDWGNNFFGDCGIAEEAFAKECGNPDFKVTDEIVVEWANAHKILNESTFLDVIRLMQFDGFPVFNEKSKELACDGKYLSVPLQEVAIQKALCYGPLKFGVADVQLHKKCMSYDWASGWVATGFVADSDVNHCVSLCGYGTFSQLSQQIQIQMKQKLNIIVQLQSKIDDNEIVYALFTWGTIGIIDKKSLLHIASEAWLRSPTTVKRQSPIVGVSLSRRADGGTQLFAINNRGKLYTRYRARNKTAWVWHDWVNLLTPDIGLRAIASAHMDGKPVELFALDENGCPVTSTQQNLGQSDPDTSSSPALSTWKEIGSLQAEFIAAGYYAGALMQVFCVDSKGFIQTCMQQSNGSVINWGAWEVFQQPTDGTFQSICVSYLPNGKMQLFALNSTDQVYTNFVTSDAEGAPWTGWIPFQDNKQLNCLTVGDLSKNVIQVFGIDRNQQIWTSKKESSDLDAQFSPWILFSKQKKLSTISASFSAGQIAHIVGVDESDQTYVTELTSPATQVWSDWVGI